MPIKHPQINISDGGWEPYVASGIDLGTVLEMPDDNKVSSAGFWDLGLVTFTYDLQADNTMYVIEGQMRIEVDGKEPMEAGPGALFRLTEGDVVNWTVTEPAKILFFLTSSHDVNAVVSGEIAGELKTS